MAIILLLCVVDCLTPLTMILLGFYFSKGGPKEVNMLFGYRTTMSTLNNDTWHYAQTLCGKLYLVSGLIEFVVTLLILYMLRNDPLRFFVNMSIGIMIVQVVIMVLVCIPVEYSLRKTFDKDGKRKDPVS